MRYRFFVFFFLLFFATNHFLDVSNVESSEITNPNANVILDVRPDFSDLGQMINMENIQNHIANFSSFQSRVTGYPGYELAVDYIESFYTNQGLTNVSTMTYPNLVAIDQGTTVEVNDQNFTAHTLMPNSFNTGKANGISGTLVYGGTGSYLDLDGKKIEDSIVVLEFNSQDNWINVASLGAKGVIFLTTNDTNRFEAEEKILDIPLNFPRVYIHNQTASNVIKTLAEQNSQTSRIFSRMEWITVDAKNVMGLIPGNDDDILIISAHFDSLSVIPSIAPGADEACGIATLLELIRVIKDNNITPEKTIMFLALSGHNQEAAGARNFVDQYYSLLNVDSGFKLFISLDLSATNTKVGINPYGYLYEFQLQFTTGNNLMKRMSEIGEDYLEAYAEDILTETGTSFSVESYITNSQFKHITPNTFVGDQEPFVAANVIGLSLFTAETHRARFNTPADLPNSLQYNHLEEQVVYVICALTALITETSLDNHLDLENKLFALKTATSAHVGYGYIEGYVKEYNETEGWYNNIPNVFIRARPWHPREGSWTEYNYITKADENGYYEIVGVSSAQPDYPYEFLVEAFSFDSEGNLIKASNLGPRGQSFKRYNALTNRRTTVNPTVFDCGTIGFFSVSHPHTQVEAAELLSYQILDPDTRNEYFSYGYFGRKSVSLVFIQPNLPSIVVGNYPDKILGIYATNSNRSAPRGNGFTLSRGEYLNLGISAYITTRDLLSITKTYVNLYSSYNIQDSLVEETYQNASTLLTSANALRDNYEYSALIVVVSEAQAWAYDSFRQARQVIQDGTTTTIFFAILLLPFAFAMSALLFDFDSGLKRISATSGIYAITFGIFYFIHPGLHLSSNIAMIIVGVIAAIFVFPTLYMIYSEGYDFLKSLRIKALGGHFADSSRTSTILIAMSTGIARMKKRKGRTIIALSGIVLITFSLTLFTSASTQVSTFIRGQSQIISYEGIYLRSKDWEFPLPEGIIDNLESTYGDQILIASRWWLYPPSDIQSLPNGYVNVETQNETASWQGSAILGITPNEPQFQPVTAALISGKWFTQSNSSECIFTDFISNQLGVGVNDTVIWAGQELFVVGIISSSQLDQMIDMSGEKITPKNNHAPAPNVHIRATETFIIPAQTAKTFGATLSSLSIQTSNESVAIEIAQKISSTYGRGLQVRVGYDDEVAIYSHTVESLGKGLGDLIIPLLIAILLMVNTSVSTVYESRKEINTFTSLGLAPFHIAGLFLAEFLVYAVIGSVIGYLLGITSAVILSALGVFPASLAINYSSGSVFSALGLGIIGILLSTVYPLRISAKMSVPSVRRSWELKTAYEEDGKTWHIPLPFVAATEQEAAGIIEFLWEYFFIYESESVGGVFFAQNIQKKDTTVDRKEKHLTAVVNLAPFDAGLKQKVDLYTYLDEMNLRWVFVIHLERLEGILMAWESSVRRYVDAIRKQLLIWRSLPKEEKAAKAEKYKTDI